jgi:DivIVA domain-containing protein
MTPLEIQKREFSRRWKGLDPVEVQTYLTDVAEDMEALARENADLETRLRSLEVENEEHRERERILKQTLLSAQQASEDIRAAARKEAELVVREAQDSSEKLTHSALQRSAEIEKAIHELESTGQFPPPEDDRSPGPRVRPRRKRPRPSGLVPHAQRRPGRDGGVAGPVIPGRRPEDHS